MRDGEEVTETVALGHWPDSEVATQGDESNNQVRLGISVAELDDAMRERLNIEGGVAVRQIEPGSVAAQAGLHVGDVLVSVDHRSVSSPDELLDIVEQLPSDRAIPVRVYREGRSLFLALRLE